MTTSSLVDRIQLESWAIPPYATEAAQLAMSQHSPHHHRHGLE